MPRLARLDAELVRRGEAADQAEAHVLIAEGRVRVSGSPAANPKTQVPLAAPITVNRSLELTERYVSRAGVKLAGALDALGEAGPRIEGAYCLDAGAATGGFTDVLLRRGARHVWAADVGYGQIAWRLRQDERVSVMDRTNVRELTAGSLTPPPGLITADLSFISLTTVLPAFVNVSASRADMLIMVKPQFEAPREDVGARGVVTDPAVRAAALVRVAARARELGLGVQAVQRSPLPGPQGNVEFFLYLLKGAGDGLDSRGISAAIARETGEGGTP